MRETSELRSPDRLGRGGAVRLLIMRGTPSMGTRVWSTTTSPKAFRVLVPS
jgi:hypothetical protein